MSVFLLPDETYFTTYIRLSFSEKVMSQTTSSAPLYYQFAMKTPEGVALRYTDCLLPNSEAALKAVSRYVLESPNEPVSVIYLDEKTSFNTAFNALNKKSSGTDPICKGNNTQGYVCAEVVVTPRTPWTSEGEYLGINYALQNNYQTTDYCRTVMTCREEVAPGGGGPDVLTTVPQVPVRTVDTNSPPPGIIWYVWGVMKKSERRLCWENVPACLTAQNTMIIASAVDGANSFIFYNSWSDCSPRNALKHAYWNALMTYWFKSESVAKRYADAHEVGDGLDDRCELQPGRINPASKMDYQNNHIGRQLGLKLVNSVNNLTPDHIYGAVYALYNAGQLVVACEANNGCFIED